MFVCLMRTRGLALAAVCLVPLLSLSCGGESSPSSSTPPTTLPSSPPPPPTTSVGDSFSHLSCPFGKGSASPTCSRESSRLLAELEAAMETLIKQKPQVFDLNDEYAPGTRAFRILDKEAYAVGLVANLRAAGLCAERDADDALLETIKIKNESDFSEDFDVILSTGHMRRGNGAYRQTCNPSSFPVERAADAPPIGSGCGKPYPPPISRFKCKLHLNGEEFDTLDSTPLVGPDLEYCNSVGFTGQTICPVRPEGTVDRVACENWRVGKAKDTGRYGPTWTKADGSFCTGPESGCANAPNQYQLSVYRSGTYVVTAENGANCTVVY